MVKGNENKKKSLISRIWNQRHVLRSLLQTLYFNFHYLPWRQAIHLPILLYKPKLLSTKGKVKICYEGKITYGMIRLGFYHVSIYPNTGIMYENHGGTITFYGRCTIGNNAAISIGPKAVVDIGDNVKNTSSLKFVSYDKVQVGNCVRFGWDCLLMDTDFHKLTKTKGGYSKGHAPVVIGNNNWFGNGCRIMKRTSTPDYCIVQGGTTLSGPVDAPPYSVVGTDSKIIVKTTGVWRNVDDDVIEY